MSISNKILFPIFVSLISFGTAIADQNSIKTPTDAIQGPWMVGPLLAPAGTTIPKGHWDLETYLFVTDDNGIYNNYSGSVSAPAATNISPTPQIGYGLTNWMDLTFIVPYNFKEKEDRTSSGVGDASVVLGFQALHDHGWVPDLRLTLSEMFPNGRYRNLNPNQLGVDTMGAGSYQTNIGANFQKMHQFSNGKYLSTRLALSETFLSSARVKGFNAYGGGYGTNGNVKPGVVFTADLGLEYTLTQNWVPALDLVYSANNQTTFSGTPGTDASGLPAINTAQSGFVASVAPAIEYNFSSDFGIIGGVWFSVAGRNADKFTSGVVALNWYW